MAAASSGDGSVSRQHKQHALREPVQLHIVQLERLPVRPDPGPLRDEQHRQELPEDSAGAQHNALGVQEHDDTAAGDARRRERQPQVPQLHLGALDPRQGLRSLQLLPQRCRLGHWDLCRLRTRGAVLSHSGD